MGVGEHMRECKMASLNESRSQSPAKAVKPSLANVLFLRLGLLRKVEVRSGSVRFGRLWLDVEWMALAVQGAGMIGIGVVVQAMVWSGPSGRYGFGAISLGKLVYGLVHSGSVGHGSGGNAGMVRFDRTWPGQAGSGKLTV